MKVTEILPGNMRASGICITKKDIPWNCSLDSSLSFAGFTNGGYSFLENQKGKRTKVFFRLQQNFVKNSMLFAEKDQVEDFFDYLNGKDFWEMNKASFHATVKAHREKLPCLILEVERMDEYHFGQLFYFFMFSCYVSARILGVNPFDQPGVEAYKKWMFEALGK